MERQSKHKDLGKASGPSARSACLILVTALVASSASMAATGAETSPNTASGASMAATGATTSSTTVTIFSTILGSSLITAVVTYLLSRRKTNAEVDKTNAEVEKIRAETAKIKLEMQNLSGTVQELKSSSERTLIDGTNGLDGFTVRGQGGQFWQGQGQQAQAISPKGTGELTFEENGILNIRRTNTDGRYELYFQQYRIGDTEKTVIPSDVSISGKRKIRVRCEAKTTGGQHTLRFLLKVAPNGDRFQDVTKTVGGNDWTKLDIFLQCDPSQDVFLRIDDEAVTTAPSSLQLRRVTVTERIS